MGGVTDEVLLARAFLNRVAEPASVALWDLVRTEGPVQAAEKIRSGTATTDVSAVARARCAVTDPYADLETADRLGIRLVVPESDDWPHFAFSALESTGAARARSRHAPGFAALVSGEPVPPIALWVRGDADLAALGTMSVGMVGSRAATAYGEHVTADLGFGLAQRGITIVSGGAFGIDAAAHRAALAAGGETVIVSAGGLDRPYPPGNGVLFEQVADAGLVVSESPPGAAPHRHRFLTRNRLIAALSTGTVVVEAAHRSGAANTAAHCTRLGRALMAVPGPVTSAMSVGCHDLLRRESDPAILVTDVDDVLAVLGRFVDPSPGAGDPAATVDEVRRTLDNLDPLVQRVYDGFPARRETRPDELALASGVPALDVIRSLPMLELAGLVEATGSGYRIGTAARRKR